MLLATGLPALLYIATASAYAHWLDTGEFVSSASDLGIAHPPGSPVASIVLATARLLPFGPLALRIAFLCGVATTLAAACFYRALHRTLVAIGVHANYVAVPIAVGATWAFAGSRGVWLQAVRPEVYAIQALLMLFIVERLVHLETVQPSRDTRAVGEVGLAFGLGLANHHLLAFLILPAAMGTFARIVSTKGVKPLRMAALGTALGLVPYLLLPIRAMRSPMLSLGEPSSIARFFWVVSARAFQHNQGSGIVQPLEDRIADVGDLLLDEVTPLGLLAAMAGLLLLVRRPAYRRFAMLWGTVFVTFLLARAWLGFVKHNPDALGYLMPATAAAIALGALGAALAVQRFVDSGKHPLAIAGLFAILVATFGLAQVSRAASSASLARFADTDAFDDALRRDLPPEAVVFVFYPQTAFRFWGGQAEDGARPDVTIVAVPFLSYPGAIDRLANEHHELAPVLRSYALSGHLTLPELQTLANQRPVLIEMDPFVPESVRDALAPNGAYFELLPGGTTDGDEREGRRAARRTFLRLAQLIDPVVDDETRAQVVWRQFQFATYFARFGDLESARACLAVARRFAPEDQALIRAEEAVGATVEGHVDLGAVLRGDAPR